MHISRTPSCVFGTRIDQHGLHPVQDKVETILKARSPENVQELQAVLGLMNYNGRFLYNLSNVLAPLHKVQGTEVVVGTAITGFTSRTVNVVKTFCERSYC